MRVLLEKYDPAFEAFIDDVDMALEDHGVVGRDIQNQLTDPNTSVRVLLKRQFDIGADAEWAAEQAVDQRMKTRLRLT